MLYIRTCKLLLLLLVPSWILVYLNWFIVHYKNEEKLGTKMTAQAWVAVWETQWINFSSLRISTNSNNILNESEKPKTSALTSYKYIHWKKKGILRLRGKNRFSWYRKAPFQFRLCLPKGLVQSHAAILVPRPLQSSNTVWISFFKNIDGKREKEKKAHLVDIQKKVEGQNQETLGLLLLQICD